MVENTFISQGLHYFLAGSDFDFRYAKQGQAVYDQLNKMIASMAVQPSQIYLGHQVHGNKIVRVGQMEGKAFGPATIYPYTDGLITDQAQVALVIKFADCTPIVLHDPKQGVLALLHSGWRGTKRKIGPKALAMMVEDYGCRLEDIQAHIGPSIGQSDYEVGLDVYQAFQTNPDYLTFFEPHAEDKYLLDMNGLNQHLLEEEGLDRGQIQVDERSTFQDSALHSARQEGKDYGLNAIAVMMEKIA